jgi:carbon storage regulator
MLVLSRKANEAIVINDAVRITVIGIKGDRVRLGIEAPRDVTVDRAEVHERRMRFVDVPVGAMAGDDSVDLGAVLVAGSPEDTMH